MAVPAEPDPSNTAATATGHTAADDVSHPKLEQEDSPGQSVEPTQAGARPSMNPDEQQRAEAEPASTPRPDVELDGDSQAQALASLKELCDSGLLPMNLYQENVAAIHRSSRRLQQWRERLHEKSQQLLERHAAMKVRQSCLNPTTPYSAAAMCFADRPRSAHCPPSAGARGWDGCYYERNACGCRSREADGPATDE